MRRMIPIATTVAVLASTAVSATQRSMQLPPESAGRPGFAPPVMFTPPAESQPRANWNEERKGAPVAGEVPAAPQAVAAEPAAPGETARAAKEKGAPPERSTLTRSSSSLSPQRGKVPAQTEPSLSDKGDTTAPAAAAETRKSAPSSVPAGPSAASPAATSTASMQGKHAASAAVPVPEARPEKKIRDVVAAPAPDAQTVERARTVLDETAVGEGKAEPAKEAAADPVKETPKPAAREVREVKPPAPKPHFVGQQGRAKPVALASLRGEDAGAGDRLVLARQFGAWALKCDMLISRNERICAIEQALKANEPDAFTWRLATSAVGKPLVVFEFTDRAEADKGLGISIAGFDKTIPATEWSCAEGRCSATMPIVGPVSSWFTNTSQIQFRYDRGAESVKISAAMSGFEAAVVALQNPLGLKTQVAGAPSTTVAKTAEAN